MSRSCSDGNYSNVHVLQVREFQGLFQVVQLPPKLAKVHFPSDQVDRFQLVAVSHSRKHEKLEQYEVNCEKKEVSVEGFEVEKRFVDNLAFLAEACQEDEIGKKAVVVVAVVAEKGREKERKRVRYLQESEVGEAFHQVEEDLLEPFVALSLVVASGSVTLAVRERAFENSWRERDREDLSNWVEEGEQANEGESLEEER